MPKDHENGNGHPAVHSNLPSGQGQSVSFKCGFDSVANSRPRIGAAASASCLLIARLGTGVVIHLETGPRLAHRHQLETVDIDVRRQARDPAHHVGDVLGSQRVRALVERVGRASSPPVRTRVNSVLARPGPIEVT